MRVLHVTSSFPRHDRDFIAPFLLDLMHAEQAVGLDVLVVAPHDGSLGSSPRSEVGGVPVRWFRYGPTRLERLAYRGGLLAAAKGPAAGMLPVFLASMARATVDAARAFRPDVIHAHWWLPAGLCALPAARLLRRPLLITVHGSDLYLLRWPLVRPLARVVLRGATRVAAVSEDVRRRLAAFDPRLTPLVLRLPLPSGPPPVPPPPCPPLRLLAAGRLVPEKGFDVLLRAVRQVVADGVDVEVEIVGDGPLRERLEALARPLAGRVRFPGPLSRADLLDRMDAAHVVVVPSRREGLGLVALEAVCRQRWVIASRVGGLPEVIEDGETGLLVPPDDASALARAIGECAREGDLRPPANDGLSSSVLTHAPQKVGQSHSDAYASLGFAGGPRR